MAEYCHALNIKIVNESDKVQFSEAYFFPKKTLDKVLWSKLNCSLNT